MKTNTTTNTKTNQPIAIEAQPAETTVVNPFENLTAVTTTQSGTRKLAYTAVLQDKARAMTTDLIRRAGGDATLAPLANAMLADKTPESLLAFINAGIDAESMSAAALVLDGCPADDLPKMLESQRSNRSKAKRTGLTAMPKVIDYVASMVGELLIRERTGKAYSTTGKLPTDHDTLAADQDALVKRINSLASKKSRLVKLAAYDTAAKAELDAVEAELQDLRALRPNKSKTVVKSIKLDDVKAALAAMSEEEKASLLALMQQAK